ncbi:MAG: GAF domain-containing protein [Chloroflexota bacterium]
MGAQLTVNPDVLSRTLKHLAKALEGLCYFTAVFEIGNEALELISVSNIEHTTEEELPQKIPVNISLLEKHLRGDIKFHTLPDDSVGLSGIFQFIAHFQVKKVALVAFPGKGEMLGLVLVGAKESQTLTTEDIQPCINIVNLATIIIDQTEATQQTNLHVAQLEALTAISQASVSDNIAGVFGAIHEQVSRLIGDYAFIAALYDEKTASIRIPYSYEDGKISSIETFPLGEGLITILIHTKQPLLLNEDVERQAESLGAKVIGKPARSWMGVPLMIANQVIGAFIVQDLERDGMFRQKDIQTLYMLAQQVAGILHSKMLLDESHRQVFQIQTAAQIARDISSALNLDELLLKAVNLIRERLNFYHAAIFLVDNTGKNVIIREATGEAGAQMKRSGHKLAIGSKSIVGFVAGQGDPLVVNDTAKDATHLPNPLLPDTRAEAAIPLKIGDHTLGVLDVQSVVPFSFGPSDLDTLQILADQLAIAVNNSELFAETQEHLSQHRLLHHITTSAASGTTLDEALESAVKGLQVSLGGDRVLIMLTDLERKNLIPKAWVGYSEDVVNRIIPIGTGITGWVAAHRKSLRIDDIAEDTRYIQLSPNTRSEMTIPLIFRNELLGVLNVESEQIAAYTDNDEEMLGTLAGSLAAIIANARLLEQIRRQAERERLLYEITSKIRQSTDMQTILMTTVGELSRVTSARKAQITIGIKNDDGNETAS